MCLIKALWSMQIWLHSARVFPQLRSLSSKKYWKTQLSHGTFENDKKMWPNTTQWFQKFINRVKSCNYNNFFFWIIIMFRSYIAHISHPNGISNALEALLKKDKYKPQGFILAVTCREDTIYPQSFSHLLIINDFSVQASVMTDKHTGYTECPKKSEWRFVSTLRAKNVIFVYIIR